MKYTINVLILAYLLPSAVTTACCKNEHMKTIESGLCEHVNAAA